MKFKSTLLLFIAFVTSSHLLACNSITLFYEWPLFDNHESSPELKEEAQEFLEYLLSEINEGREFALDAWAQPKMASGIIQALGTRKYLEQIRLANNGGNSFAYYALVARKIIPRNDAAYDKLAESQNPEFLTDITNVPHELAYFWSKFGHHYKDIDGADPKEKLLNFAISKKWTIARIRKALMLFANHSQNQDETRLKEAFALLRYAATRGYSQAMYEIHLKLQEYPQHKIADNEGREMLEAAADLNLCVARYSSAMHSLSEENFSAAHRQLDKIISEADFDKEICWLRENARVLKDLAFLLERKITQDGDFEFNCHISYHKSRNLITPSMRKMISYLRTMFEEVDRMSEILEDEKCLDDEIPNVASYQPSFPVESNHDGMEKDDVAPVDNVVTQEEHCDQTEQTKKQPSSQLKVCKKREKVAARRANRQAKKSRESSNNTNHNNDIRFADNPFAGSLRARLAPVYDLVDILLEGGHLNGRETKRFLNSLQTVAVDNTVGSHNKVNVQSAEGCPEEKMTIVKPHNGKRRDLTGKYKSMSSNIRGMLHGLGISTIDDLK